MNKSKIIAILFVACMNFPSFTYAGWFGPNNYDDCVLEKMKGQDKSMLYTARKACEKEFPFEKELPDYKEDIEIGWYNEVSSLHLDIQKNFGEYEITRYRASFSKKSCDEVESTSDYAISKTFDFSSGGNSSSVRLENASEFKCMRTDTIWGKYKK